MSGIPVAIQLVWTTDGVIYLQCVMFRAEMGSDCLRYRGFIR